MENRNFEPKAINDLDLEVVTGGNEFSYNYIMAQYKRLVGDIESAGIKDRAKYQKSISDLKRLAVFTDDYLKKGKLTDEEYQDILNSISNYIDL